MVSTPPSPRPRPVRPRPNPLPGSADETPALPAGHAPSTRSIQVPSLLAAVRRTSFTNASANPSRTATVARGASVGAIAVGAALFVVTGLTSPVVADNVALKSTPKSDRPRTSAPAVPAFSGAPAAPVAATVPPRSAAPKAPSDPAAISALAGNGIPKVALNAYRVAAARVNHSNSDCDIDWSLLAGIGRVESNHGRFGGSSLRTDGTSTPPIVGPALTGTTWDYFPASPQYIAVTGDSKYAHALGPMQFIPSTWRSWGSDANGDGKADVFNINDAALAAARYLCAAGGDLGSQAGRARAVHAYNHNDTYVAQVLALADAYKRGVPVSGIPVGNITGSLPKDGHTGTLPPVNPAAPPAAAKKPATKPKSGTKTGGSGGSSGGSGSSGGTKAGGTTNGGSGSGGSGSGGSSGGSGGTGSSGGSGGSGGGSSSPPSDPPSSAPTDTGTPTPDPSTSTCSLDLLGNCINLG